MKENIVYIISIIDYLQVYNFYKYLETNLKYYMRFKDDLRAISCVPPDIYYDRFVEFINKITSIELNNS